MIRIGRFTAVLIVAALLISTIFGSLGRATATEDESTPAVIDAVIDGSPTLEPDPTETPATLPTTAPTEIESAPFPTVENIETPILSTTPSSAAAVATPMTTPSRTPAVVSAATAAPAPKISLSAASGHVGDTFRIQVDFYPAGSQIVITFDGVRKVTIVANVNGRARGSLVVPAGAGGAHEIRATVGNRYTTKVFSITPQIRFAPTSSSPGTALTATLTGFKANSKVKFRLFDLDDNTVVSVWSATMSSTGGATTTVKTKSSTKSGTHTVRAVGPGGFTAQTAVTIVAKTGTIATDVLNLRADPSTNGNVLAQMLHGETVQIIEISGDWVHLTYNGQTGWAFGSYLKLGGDSASIWVPTHQQEHSLSCEYASLQIATSALGDEIAEDRFIPVVGLANNPHNGFRGNIDGVDIFGTDDYGVYPEALADALPTFGFHGTVFYGGVSTLKSHLRAGQPVVVWIDLGFNTSFTMMIDGEPVTMAPRSHVVVAYGFSDEGVLISDPDSSTRKRLIPWSDFNVMWNSMDQMALAVTR